MKQTLNFGTLSVPTANIAVNKSRLKVYKNNDTPTYYLEKGQEFQFELFNPTKDTVLAKITLNNKPISQGGLIINPGQRIFLDRYIDVPKKFMFDTYEVSNTEEVKEAIENNGDVKVEFFRELVILNTTLTTNFGGSWYPVNNTGIAGASFTTTGIAAGTFTNDSYYSNNVNYSNTSLASNSNLRSKSLKSKKIETGRVEEGSGSNQKFKTVNKQFSNFSFHTVEYKLLPVSQKINTSEDISVRRYCTNCGAKLHKDHKFCGHCATKV
jgi:hypothetical protein